MNKIKILFISSNPSNLSNLSLKSEFTAIDNEIRQSPYSSHFELIPSWDTQVTDLQKLLLRYKPDIVHISGHGNEKSEIILQDEHDAGKAISADALKIMFALFKEEIQCVILNMCHSEKQSLAIAKEINFVVGTSGKIGNKLAIEFARSFYRGLANGKDINKSFQLGKNAIGLSDGKQSDVIVLKSRINPKYSFVSRRMQANKVMKQIEEGTPYVVGGVLANKIWNKIKNSPDSDKSGQAEELLLSSKDNIKDYLTKINVEPKDFDLLEKTGDGDEIIEKGTSLLDDIIDFFF
jgi:hypothetical protein